MPDWQQSDGDGKPKVSGYDVLATMSYHNCGRYDGHKNTYLFSAEIPLQTSKTVAQVRLPYDSGRADLHLFDVAIS